MKVNKTIFPMFVILFMLFVSACSNGNDQTSDVSSYSETSEIASSSSEITSVEVSEAPSSETIPTETGEDGGIQPPNMVDERFELLSLVFRLAGRDEYSDSGTEYQKKLVSEFNGYKDHEAVAYAGSLPLGYDAVFKFAVHIIKDGEGFIFIDDIASLVEDGRWTRESAAEFLSLLNNFYKDSKFTAFYQLNVPFYEAETERFMENTYSEIDHQWFADYVDPDNLRCIYSPSSSRMNYSATVNNTVVYCGISGEGSAIVHEYVHSFANPIAAKWYEENAEFRGLCDDTVDLEKLPNYGNGFIIAGEYVTRAYNTLYYADHGDATIPHLYMEKGEGFPYIEDVYAMITDYVKPSPEVDIIAEILGTGYTMGEEQTLSLENRVIRWKQLALDTALPYSFEPTEVGNAFGTDSGDVLHIEDTDVSGSYLLIDVGDGDTIGSPGYRLYSRIPLD